MSKSKEIRLLKKRLDYYTMEAEDDQFDAEEVIRLLKRLDELEPLPEPDMSAEESLEAFWEYVKEREREEKIIAGRKSVGKLPDFWDRKKRSKTYRQPTYHTI